MSAINSLLDAPSAAWIESLTQPTCVEALPRQASKRYYYRVYTGEKTQIFMDSSQELQTAKDFVRQQSFFNSLGFRVPATVAADLASGYLLIEDFGTQRLLEYLLGHPQSADDWYAKAMRLIHHLHAAAIDSNPEAVETNAAFMVRESTRSITEFLPSLPEAVQASIDVDALHCGVQQLSDYLDGLPKYVAHGDFHAANLMCVDKHELGVLDFQAPFVAPAPYDLVSLLKDCYVTWPRDQVEHWVRAFYEDSSVLKQGFDDVNAFIEAFDAMGLQRHLKCLGLFRHLADSGQAGYADHLVPVMNYIVEVCQLYPQWAMFLPLVEQGLLCYR